MIEIPFTKIEGAQNDFIVIDNRARWFPRASMKLFASFVCHRRKGIGADGVIFIEPHAQLDFTMLFFNPDGSDGSMCGNGGRCAILFAHHRKFASGSVRFEVLGQTYVGEMTEEFIRIYFPEPRKLKFSFKLKVFDQLVTTHYAHVGAPHALIFIEDIEKPRVLFLDELNIDSWGKAVRRHFDFQPEGVNANFLSIDNENIVHVRTFEKGVEAETEACGTGTVASALIAHVIKKLSSPIIVETHGGDRMRIGFEIENQHVKNIYLEGPAREVFNGVVVYDEDSRTIHT